MAACNCDVCFRVEKGNLDGRCECRRLSQSGNRSRFSLLSEFERRQGRSGLPLLALVGHGTLPCGHWQERSLYA